MYEDVIPADLYDSSMATKILLFLNSLPISSIDKITIFLAWSKDVGYSYTVKELDVLRSS